MNIKDLVEEAGIRPKRKAATNGGEYCSACPFCRDGDDRFLIWPEQRNRNGDYTGGRFSCRVCGSYGDAVTFIMKYEGVKYQEACKRLKVTPKPRAERGSVKLVYSPPEVKDPPAIWMEKAGKFVDWCNAQILKDEKLIAELGKRGITVPSIVRFNLGYNPGEDGRDILRDREAWGLPQALKEDGTPRKIWLPKGIVIPSHSAGGNVVKLKIRRTNWKEGDKLPKYAEVSGSRQSLSIFGDRSLNTALIVESELDAILIQQFAGDLVYCVALGGSTKPIDKDTKELLDRTPTLLFCPDFDVAGKKAWDKWKRLFPNTRILLTPETKSAGDAHLEGLDLREWILEELEDIESEEK